MLLLETCRLATIHEDPVRVLLAPTPSLPTSLMSALRAGASAYRRLFRARQVAFFGDRVALRESRVALRAEFHAGPAKGEKGLDDVVVNQCKSSKI